MKKAKRTKPVEYPHATIRPMEVENPNYSRQHEGARGNPKTITVMVNIRESAIATMASRGHLQPHHVMAANRLRKILEAAGRSGARAIDYGREPVDGGGTYDPVPDMMIDAGKELVECAKIVGTFAFKYLELAVGQGCELGRIGTTQREKTTRADYIRDGLDALAQYWQLATRKN